MTKAVVRVEVKKTRLEKRCHLFLATFKKRLYLLKIQQHLHRVPSIEQEGSAAF
ncbi:putative PB, isoform B [Roseibium sp. TrichSKD4]|nr:putative PB, isoform B [Roseibium sp. TrichSKD4]